MPSDLSHVTIAASDFAASLACYDAALAALGCTRLAEFGDEEEDEVPVEAVAWGRDVALVWLVPATSAAGVTRNAHVAFEVAARATVDAFHAAAVAAGAASHRAPRRWTVYRRGRYAASVRDPDGNLLEAGAPE